MSGLATDRLAATDGAVAAEMFSPAAEESAMRARLVALRDTIIVLALQLVFRTMMLLRRWNY